MLYIIRALWTEYYMVGYHRSAYEKLAHARKRLHDLGPGAIDVEYTFRCKGGIVAARALESALGAPLGEWRTADTLPPIERLKELVSHTAHLCRALTPAERQQRWRRLRAHKST